MAAPSKLTPDRKKRILEAIALGATYELAAQYGGVSYNTFNSWMKEGAAAKSGGKMEFFRQVKEAEGKAAAKWLAKIEQAASDGAWQAAAWKLERRYPAAYGRQDRVSGAVHLEHSQGTDLKVTVQQVLDHMGRDDELVEALRDRQARADAGTVCGGDQSGLLEDGQASSPHRPSGNGHDSGANGSDAGD